MRTGRLSRSDKGVNTKLTGGPLGEGAVNFNEGRNSIRVLVRFALYRSQRPRPLLWSFASLSILARLRLVAAAAFSLCNNVFLWNDFSVVQTLFSRLRLFLS